MAIALLAPLVTLLKLMDCFFKLNSPIFTGYSSAGFAGFGITSPLMYSLVVGTVALLVTVTVFWKRPGRPLGLYVTVICPFCPGSIGS